MPQHYKPAVLILADGSEFPGIAIGAEGECVGEVVFNTSMTGYQEILSDPSYAQQIITMTYPHIGNVGCNTFDNEAKKPWLAGLIIRDLPKTYSNWRAQQSLPEYLCENDIVAIAEIDTRALTRKIREQGAQAGCISTGNITRALEKAKKFPGLEGKDLASYVTTQEPYEWQQGCYDLASDQCKILNATSPLHIVAYDFGVKQHILQLFVERGCRVTVIPATTSAEDVLAMKPDGVFLSNGPGDPKACDYAITAIQTLMQHKIPLFGICLGFQLIALACGAKSFKMKFGHHGANHPVINLATEKVFITSQNHGFAIDESSLPDNVIATHRSLFDGTLQGIKHRDLPVIAFQGHPEASPGPQDLLALFDEFMRVVNTRFT